MQDCFLSLELTAEVAGVDEMGNKLAKARRIDE